MRKELKMVEDFHQKFGYIKNDQPTLINQNEVDIRYRIMKEEVEEYLSGANNKDLHNLAKELCDILYTTYGTVVAHGLQDIIEDIFQEVHGSNMSKDTSEIKPKKGAKYYEPKVEKFFSEK